jgi:Fe-S oxidoreductase
MGLLAPAKALLSRIPGARIIDPDAGCCGMAGSFGYSRDHYEVSRAIGERRLMPAIRNRTRGTPVVASGFSCRHQIKDFTGETAVHPAVLLKSVLPGQA